MDFMFRVNLEEHVFRSGKNFKKNNNSSVTEDSLMGWSISRQTCYIVFAVLTFMTIVATVVRSLTFVSVYLRSSVTLHKKMFNAITRATMYFFNTNSSGIIKIKM